MTDGNINIKETKIYKKRKKENYRDVQIKGNRRTAMAGIFMALAMILSYFESLIPFNFMVPGIKLGLANLVTIISMVKLGVKTTILISFGRIILSGILFGNFTVIIYSMAGAAVSILIMYLVRKIGIFTTTGVSICGAIAHNFGQIVVACIVLDNTKIMYYMVVLAAFGAVSGAIIGIFATLILRNIRF